MDSSGLLAAFRVEVVDTIKPLLWSDAEIFGYMDDAQKLFCRLTGGITDASSPLTQLPLKAGQDWVPISPLILKIRNAYRSTDGTQVNVIDSENLVAWGILFDGRTSDQPDALVIGLELKRVRLYPVPTALSTGVVQLMVDRLPLLPITGAGQPFEILEQHHINLLMWMKHRAYGKTDADTYDVGKATNFGDAFNAYCVSVAAERARMRSEFRVVRFAGGPHAMDSGRLLVASRNELSDTVKPMTWSDEELFDYIDEAQKLFCRLTGGLADVSSPLTQLPLTAGVEWVPLSPLILRIRDAYTTWDGRGLTIVNYEDLPPIGIRFNGRTTQYPEALIIGMDAERVRIYPIPDVTTTGFIQLVVDRLPMESITGDSQTLEIAKQHHLSLLMWVKHRAYGRHDSDARDDRKADEFGAAFEKYCADAKREKERAREKVRIVRYGGIGGHRTRRYAWSGSTWHW